MVKDGAFFHKMHYVFKREYKSWRGSKSLHWVRSYGDFSEQVDFTKEWSCIRKGLRLQPAQQAWFYIYRLVFPNKKNQFWKAKILKATVENTRGSVEKLSLKESVKGGDTALRERLRAPKGFSKGKPKAAKPRRRSPQGSAAKGLFEENPEGALKLPRSAVWAPEALSWGDIYSTLPQGFSTVSQTRGKIYVHTNLWTQ